ncbi:unnamed protein product, partial [Brachionus calyciflorus]
CSDNTYGLNCNQTCQCSSNSLRCDPVDGCVCNPGYKGISCELVINACESNIKLKFFLNLPFAEDEINF